MTDDEWRSSIEARLDSLEVNVQHHLPDRLHAVEELAYYMDSPLWRRIVWAIDGWPWWKVRDYPQWRPWRRWWTS